MQEKNRDRAKTVVEDFCAEPVLFLGNEPPQPQLPARKKRGNKALRMKRKFDGSKRVSIDSKPRVKKRKHKGSHKHSNSNLNEMLNN